MRKKVLLIIAGLSALVIAGIVLTANQSDSPSSQSISEPANQVLGITLTDYYNKQVKLAAIQGPLVINSWAAWCPFCVKELTDFAAVQKEFGDQITIIAIDRAETRDTAKQYTDQLGVGNDLLFLLDPDDSFYQAIGGFSMPETIFVDEDGSIAFHKRGPMDVEEMRERINQLISE